MTGQMYGPGDYEGFRTIEDCFKDLRDDHVPRGPLEKEILERRAVRDEILDLAAAQAAIEPQPPTT